MLRNERVTGDAVAVHVPLFAEFGRFGRLRIQRSCEGSDLSCGRKCRRKTKKNKICNAHAAAAFHRKLLADGNATGTSEVDFGRLSGLTRTEDSCRLVSPDAKATDALLTSHFAGSDRDFKSMATVSELSQDTEDGPSFKDCNADCTP